MLHILLMTLKIILIIIGIVLGSILAILFLLLFCPVRYNAKIQKEQEIHWKQTELCAAVGWLFWAVSLKIHFCDGKLEKQIKILGISLDKIKKGIRSLKFKKHKKKKPHNSVTGAKRQEKPHTKEKDLERTKKKLPDKPAQTKTEIEKKAETEERNSSEKQVFQEESEKVRFHAIKEKLERLVKLPTVIFEKLKNIQSAINKICRKIEWLKSLLEHPRVQEWLGFVKTEIFKILKHILPKKAKGYLIFGSEDPYITGSVLAVLGMTMPFHKNTVTFTPVFQNENVLEGNLMIKGRIYGIVLVVEAAKIFFHKNTKYIIRRWKNKEE